MPRHMDMAAEMALVRIKSGDMPALLRRQQLFHHRAAIAAQLIGQRPPVISGNAHLRRFHRRFRAYRKDGHGFASCGFRVIEMGETARADHPFLAG
ncbi:hypothetical protein NKL07_29715 [Mesorhizobium sp. C280B]|uniref:hypothetical protein n=1 Tax=unclassified Mesorhizobium TaxID=325217 RepID=UPI001FD99A31|nr:hypothetical protein [Mesorhizobium sp. LSJC280B00]